MKLYITILFCIIAFTVSAQYTVGGGGAFTIGTQLLPTAELQQFNSGSPELPSSNISIGGYGYWQIKSVVFGFQGGGFYGSTVEQGNLQYGQGGGSFSINLGYKIINTDKLGIYPVLGIGGGGIGYRITQTGDIAVSPDQGVTPYSAEYNWSSVLFDVGVRVEKIFGYESGDCGKGGGLVGLELGYMLSPSSDKWETAAGASVNNAPEYSLSGFYARLLIGGFGGE